MDSIATNATATSKSRTEFLVAVSKLLKSARFDKISADECPYGVLPINPHPSGGALHRESGPDDDVESVEAKPSSSYFPSGESVNRISVMNRESTHKIAPMRHRNKAEKSVQLMITLRIKQPFQKADSGRYRPNWNPRKRYLGG